MLENTKTYKKKTKNASKDSLSETKEPEACLEKSETSPNAANLSTLNRREWFQALRPALGNGLVKLIRTSNNLQREIHESLHEQIRTSTQKIKDDTN